MLKIEKQQIYGEPFVSIKDLQTDIHVYKFKMFFHIMLVFKLIWYENFSP